MIWSASYDQVPGFTQDASSDTTESRLVRLVEDSEIVKKIEFDELSIIVPNTNSESEEKIPVSEDELNIQGNISPIVRINEYVFDIMEITKLIIESRDIFPTITLTVEPKVAVFEDNNMPKDGDIISTYLRSSTNGLQYLRNDWVIESMSAKRKKGDRAHSITLSGKLFVYRFDASGKPFALKGTSRSAIRQLAEKHKLGFAYNDSEDTTDEQVWLNMATPEALLQEITDHAWKDETSYFKTWIDLYYNICMVNVDKFLNSSQNVETEIDITYFAHGLEATRFGESDPSAENTPLTIKFFSNSGDMKNSTFFISSWKAINNSSSVSISNGYITYSHTFIHDVDMIRNTPDSCFEMLTNQPTYDESKLDTHIILRGRSKYNKNKNPQGDAAKVNYKYLEEYVDYKWCGIQYSNAHPNYRRAIEHNRMNLEELEKIVVEITVDGLCLQAMRGERIPVILFEDAPSDILNNDVYAPENEHSTINKFYSGFYIIDSVKYSYKPTTSIESAFSTTFTLKRSQWPTPVNTTPDNKQDNSENA